MIPDSFNTAVQLCSAFQSESQLQGKDKMRLSVARVLCFLLISYRVSGFPSGAPSSVCDNMMPGHIFRGHSVPCPFITRPDKVLYRKDGEHCFVSSTFGL